MCKTDVCVQLKFEPQVDDTTNSAIKVSKYNL